MKKGLLILLCLPFIGFGQDDKLIFSSGDTIIGNVIEVGVNDITYQHKGETINNISKKRELAKVIYSSGRIETFQGLSILEFKIAKEEKDKLYKQQRKELSEKIRDSKFSIGLVVGASLNNSTGMKDYFGNNLSKSHITMTEGVSVKYLISKEISINSKLLYHISGYTVELDKTDLAFGDMISPQDGFIFFTTEDIVRPLKKYDHFNYYLTLPVTMQYNYNGFFINAGGYCAFLLKSDDNLFSEFTENTNKIYVGLTLGIGFNYELNYLWDVSLEVSSLYGLTDFYSTDFPLTEFYKRSYIGMFGLAYNFKSID
jgi:hypothetical protein